MNIGQLIFDRTQLPSYQTIMSTIPPTTGFVSSMYGYCIEGIQLHSIAAISGQEVWLIGRSVLTAVLSALAVSATNAIIKKIKTRKNG